MTASLNAEGYAQTKEKLARMEERLAALRQRTDLPLAHRAEVERSYEAMLAQYRREVKLYEAAHPTAAPTAEV